MESVEDKTKRRRLAVEAGGEAFLILHDFSPTCAETLKAL